MIRKILAALFVLVMAAFGWLVVSPPELLRVGAAYSAKMVCSNVFLAGREEDEVLSVDVQAPGNPLLKLVRVNVEKTTGVVRAGFFGIIGKGTSVYREGLGCTNVPDGDVALVQALPRPQVKPEAPGEGLWPEGNTVEPMIDGELDAILADDQLVGPGMRAIVIVKDGRIIAERYGDGFDETTPLLGWSMTKTVTAALIGTMARGNKFDINAPVALPQWAGDNRSKIRVTDLLAMQSDLTWNEGYGDVSDVTRMLYLDSDMTELPAAQPLETPDGSMIGKNFVYSSGTTVLLSRLWQDALPDAFAAADYPRNALFNPLGMTSAILETDARGTFAGSSYMYATARDWARFGQFLLQRGVWNGRSLLPVGYVDWMVSPTQASEGKYGHGQVWRPAADTTTDNVPEDTFALQGHDGQSVNIIPSQGLVIVRLGLTPSKLGYSVDPLLVAVGRAVE